MGIVLLQLEGDFYIKKENVLLAFQAIKRHHVQRRTDRGNIRNWYFDFVDPGRIDAAENFHDLLWACRWSVGMDEEGNVAFLEFLGEKLGDEDDIFQAMAPYV